MIETANLRRRFRERFGTEGRIFRAPGRVNLIGEHTDYNDGFVMPAAIQLATWIAIAPRQDQRVRVHSANLHLDFEFHLSENDPQPRRDWTDYVRGVAVLLERDGVKLDGADLLVESDVPIGGGLSSSAALEVATAYSLVSNAGQTMDPLKMAQLCQRAENEFVGMRSGIMDQFAACFGQRAHALLLDCRSMEWRPLPLPEGLSLIVCNTMVKHSLADGEYNQRRAQCEEAARLFGKRSLREVTMADFQARETELPDLLRRRARHVLSENARTLEAAEALRGHDLETFGKLMYQSHASLRDDYEVSCRELDVMTQLAREVDGVWGARMTGGGFGGSTINLAPDSIADRFCEVVARGYREATGITPTITICRAERGAQEVLGE